MAFKNELALCFSGPFKKQSDPNVAMDEEELDVRVRAEEIRPFTIVADPRVYRDCTGQFTEKKRQQRVYVAGSFRIAVTPQQLGGWFYYAMGSDTTTGTDPMTHSLRMQSGRTMPLFSLRVGHSDEIGSRGWIYKDCAVNSVTPSADIDSGDGGVYADIEVVASADRAVAESAWPACYQGDPALLLDGTFLIGATSYINQLRRISCTYSNQLLVRTDPFTGGSVHAKRFRRSAIREYGMRFALIGVDEDGNTIAEMAAANDFIGTTDSVAWGIGLSGNRITLGQPSAFIGPDGAMQDYSGEAEEGVIPIMADGKKVAGNALTPFNASAAIPAAQQAAAYGVAA